MKTLMTSFAAILMLAGVAHATGSTASSSVAAQSHSAQPMQHCQRCMKGGNTMHKDSTCCCMKSRKNMPKSGKCCCDGMHGGRMSPDAQKQLMMHDTIPTTTTQSPSPRRQ